MLKRRICSILIFSTHLCYTTLLSESMRNNYPYSTRGLKKFQGKGVIRTKKFKAIYEAELVFPQGRDRAHDAFSGGMDVF